jgi:antitoxin PrlF
MAIEQMISSLTSKGQVTIPVSLRRRLHLKASDRIEFILEDDGIKLRPVHSDLLAGFRSVKPRQTPEDFAAIRHETQEWVAERVTRELHERGK